MQRTANTMFHRLIRSAVTVAMVLIPAGPIMAADPPDRADKVRLDPATGDWVEVPPAEPGTPAGDLQLARNLHTDGHQRQAQRSIDKWIKSYGNLHELYPHAALLRCRILMARHDYYKAHLELQEFLSEFAGTEHVDEALTMEFTIAEVFFSGTKRKIWGMRILQADDIGIAILDDIAANHAGTEIGELAILTKAHYYYRTGDFVFAEQEYAALVQQYPRSRYVRQAMLQSARAALASFGGVRFDDAPLIEAEERFRQYLAQYPGAAEQEGIGLILADIAERRAAKEYDVGQYYERTDHLQAAAFYFRSTMTHWPDTIAAVQAAGRLEELGPET